EDAAAVALAGGVHQGRGLLARPARRAQKAAAGGTVRRGETSIPRAHDLISSYAGGRSAPDACGRAGATGTNVALTGRFRQAGYVVPGYRERCRSLRERRGARDEVL